MTAKEVAKVGVTMEIEEVVPIKCPCCKLRLFDIGVNTEGIISIKCTQCKTVISVSMHHKKYRCRKQRATQARPCVPG